MADDYPEWMKTENEKAPSSTSVIWFLWLWFILWIVLDVLSSW